MGHCPAQGELEPVGEGIKLHAHAQAPVGAKRYLLTMGCLHAGCKDSLAGFFLVGDQLVPDRHAHEVLLGKRVRRKGGDVPLKAGDEVRIALNLLREKLEQLILQPVLLALVIRLHQAQTRYVHIQIHLLPDAIVPGAQSLDFRIAECCFIHIVAGADGAFAGHDLGNELLLVLNGLP